MPLSFSVLDRAQNITGDTDAAAVRRAVDHATRVEKLGFTRFFTAEHHAVPGIPGSQPTLLASAVAAATDAIRVGTAGIMLPNHPPLVAAEQIGVLAALHPGRIDVGIGNSVGFTGPVRDALRQGDPAELKARYADDLVEFLGYLDTTSEVTMRPVLDTAVPLYLLAGFSSLTLAARHGLGVIVGGPSLLDDTRSSHAGLDGYRRDFVDKQRRPGRHAIISLDIAVADTHEAARDLLLPQHVAGVLARRTGEFGALQPVGDIDETDLSDRERQRLADSLATAVYGTPWEVRERLETIMAFTDAEEIVVTGGMSDIEGQQRSEELLADMMY